MKHAITPARLILLGLVRDPTRQHNDLGKPYPMYLPMPLAVFGLSRTEHRKSLLKTFLAQPFHCLSANRVKFTL